MWIKNNNRAILISYHLRILYVVIEDLQNNTDVRQHNVQRQKLILDIVTISYV